MAHLLATYPDENVFVILEDDAAFDLVEFWPGTLSALLREASEDTPDWQVPFGWINLQPPNPIVFRVHILSA